MSNTIYGPEKTPEEIAKIVEQTENSDKKIYPILKPGNWVGLKAGALSSTLIPSEDGAEVVIAYGMDTPDNFVFFKQTASRNYGCQANYPRSFHQFRKLRHRFRIR
ncbi:hypothetical protein [Formosa algae]|uniref:hypothetical protein n=1 Tax=Formosa algae TaxID=225843 RepID=UPI00209C1254|nr:hypothetical protein [Formosa algae]